MGAWVHNVGPCTPCGSSQYEVEFKQNVDIVQPFTEKQFHFDKDGDTASINVVIDGQKHFIGFVVIDKNALGPEIAVNNIIEVGGQDVKFKPEGFSITDKILENGIAAYKKDSGRDPIALPGDLMYKNKTIFQQEYIAARIANPHLKEPKDIAKIAIQNTSFGAARSKLGYGNFKFPEDFKEDTLTTKKGEVFDKVPTMIRVEAYPNAN